MKIETFIKQQEKEYKKRFNKKESISDFLFKPRYNVNNLKFTKP